jgi:D-alanyl-D-alanine carboxypeptidase
MPASHRLFASLVLLTGCIPGPGCAQHIPPGELSPAIDAFAEREDFHGVVLVARGDSVLHAGAYGYADVEARTPTTLDTRYQLGSVAKWIATIVVLDLVDDGVVSLDEPVRTYVPEFAGDPRLTLDHLITHTSGVPNDLIAAYRADPGIATVDLTLDEAARRYASGQSLFAPGSRFDYSHSNWILVALVVERVTDASFEANVRERIVQPLGLADTGAFWHGGPNPQIAPGYEQVDPPRRSDAPVPRYLMAAGGLYSSAPDLLALVAAIYNGHLLSDASRQRLDSVSTPDDDLSQDGLAGGYARGGHVRAMRLGGRERRVLWHTGSNGPSKSRVSRVLGGDAVTVVTLTNTGVSPESTGDLTERVLGALYDRSPEHH